MAKKSLEKRISRMPRIRVEQRSHELVRFDSAHLPAQGLSLDPSSHIWTNGKVQASHYRY